MGGKTWHAAARTDQGTKLLQIGRIERWVIGKGPWAEAIDNFRRRSEQMFVERFKITVGFGPLPKLRPDIGARRAPARMQEDRFFCLNVGLDLDHLSPRHPATRTRPSLANSVIGYFSRQSISAALSVGPID